MSDSDVMAVFTVGLCLAVTVVLFVSFVARLRETHNNRPSEFERNALDGWMATSSALEKTRKDAEGKKGA